MNQLHALRSQKFQPEFVVDELSEMSAWLGQRHHYFDEI